MKRLILKWAARQFADMLNENAGISYHDLEAYGIADIIRVQATGEPAVVFDGVKDSRGIPNTKSLI